MGAVLLAAGTVLAARGAAGWCSLEGMPTALTRVVGGGLAVSGALLFLNRTAVFGLLAAVAWIILWGWAFAGTLWGRASCWVPAVALGVLFSSMGLTGYADRRRQPGRATNLMVFFAVAWLAGGLLLWLRSG